MMGQRVQLPRAWLLGGFAIVLFPILFCVGSLVVGPKQSDRVVAALRDAGVGITTVDDGPIVNKQNVVSHKVFHTTDGREGHILISGSAITSAIQARLYANDYLAGDKYVFYKSTAIVILDPGWRGASPEAIDRALQSIN